MFLLPIGFFGPQPSCRNSKRKTTEGSIADNEARNVIFLVKNWGSVGSVANEKNISKTKKLY